MFQAEDRAHRLGQKNAVDIHYLVAPGTIDPQIFNLLNRKRKDTSHILDGKAEDMGAEGRTEQEIKEQTKRKV